MGGFMGDEAGAGQELALGGGFIQEDAVGPVLNGAYMLHAAVLETGNQGEVEFLEGIGDAGVVLEKIQRGAV
jgi:hypothetical protein